MSRWNDGGRRRRVLVIASIAAAVVAIAGTATAVTLTQNNSNHDTTRLSGSPARVVSLAGSFKTVADVTPPVAASKCTKPTAFTYSGTLSAAAPGTVKYQWVYSGKPGPVQTVHFTSAGERAVTGETVRSEKAGGGWGEIKIISPVSQTSDKAAYKLLCGGGTVDGITATAAVTPAALTVSCGTAPPAFTATGSIEASKAERVTYYWALSDGVNSAPATLTFTAPGTQATEPLTITPSTGSGSGTAVLVVTSPVTTASSPATYTLTCKAPAANQTGQSGTNPTTSQTSPATTPTGTGSQPTSPAAPPSAMSVTVSAAATASLDEPYSGTVTVTGGDGNYTWSAVTDLPSGLTATANGATLTISGTPNVLGQSTASGEVSDGESPAQTAFWGLFITVSQPPITITANITEDATVGQPYLDTLTATGGNGNPFTWSVTGLPPSGLTTTANGATFTISGTPTTADIDTTAVPQRPEDFEVTVTVSDGATSVSRGFPIVVSPASTSLPGDLWGRACRGWGRPGGTRSGWRPDGHPPP